MPARPIEHLLSAAALIVAANVMASAAWADAGMGRNGGAGPGCSALVDGSGGRIVTAVSGRHVVSASGSQCSALRPAIEQIDADDAPLLRAAAAPGHARLASDAVTLPADPIMRVSTAPVAVVAVPLAAAIVPAAPLAAGMPAMQARSPGVLALLVAATAILLVFLMRRGPALRAARPAWHQSDVLSILATRWQREDDDSGAAGESLSGLARAFDLVEEAIVVIDRQQRIHLVNDAFLRVAGTSAQDLLGSDLSAIPWLATGFSTDASGHPWRRAVDAAHSWDIEGRSFTPQPGAPVKLAIRCTPVLDAHDRVHGCIVAFHRDDVPTDLSGSGHAAEAA